MSHFLWASGHLGWGIFAVVVFTGLWLVATDLYWRTKSVRFVRLLVTTVVAWVAGVAIIVLTFYLVNR